MFGNIGKERGEKVVEEANKDGDRLGRKTPVAREVIENEQQFRYSFPPFFGSCFVIDTSLSIPSIKYREKHDTSIDFLAFSKVGRDRFLL